MPSRVCRARRCDIYDWSRHLLGLCMLWEFTNGAAKPRLKCQVFRLSWNTFSSRGNITASIFTAGNTQLTSSHSRLQWCLEKLLQLQSETKKTKKTPKVCGLSWVLGVRFSGKRHCCCVFKMYYLAPHAVCHLVPLYWREGGRYYS